MQGVLGFLILSMVAAGCAGGEMGDHCGSHDDCDDMCQTGGSFPDGLCTRQCDGDSDCPSGWSCISRGSGICLRDCENSDECHDRFGSDWNCNEESLESGDGSVRVCIG